MIPAESMEAFSRRFRHEVYRFGRRRGLRHEDAEDVAQEVLLRVWRGALFGRMEGLQGLVLAVARRAIASHLRREFARKRDRRRQIVIRPSDVLVDDLGVRACEGREAALRVLGQMKHLEGGRLMRTLSLRLEGHSYRQIAEKMGGRIHDVTNDLHKARKRLRLELALAGGAS
ncbi:MAG TPA: sigma-70 family RNA polymerase sigma factor [Planctomycetota bacterium]|nr:sigma-70 family RNA polymerase sigma factor [Planctomycetota bacterium]